MTPVRIMPMSCAGDLVSFVLQHADGPEFRPTVTPKVTRWPEWLGAGTHVPARISWTHWWRV